MTDSPRCARTDPQPGPSPSATAFPHEGTRVDAAPRGGHRRRSPARPLRALATVAALAASTLAQQTLWEFDGPEPNDLLGAAVRGAGDVNADGFDDVIIGVLNGGTAPANVGRAEVYSGADGSLLWSWSGTQTGALFGYFVDGAGDVNADGFDDLLVSACRDATAGVDAGRVWVFSGNDGTQIWSWLGDAAGDMFGRSVAGAGDVDDDGFDDVIVGAWTGDSADGTIPDVGYARLFSGFDGSVIRTFYGDAQLDVLGVDVRAAGDVDADGFDDVIVGAYQYFGSGGVGPGYARVFSGADGALIHEFNGLGFEDLFGYSVSGAGDVDDDGYDDLVVGAYGDDDFGSKSGSAWVFSGLDGTLLHVKYGGAVNDRLGYTVSGAGDIDGDGFDDVIVGAYRNDAAALDAGSAFIYSGFDGSELHRLDGTAEGDLFGYSVSGAGDIDGDGFDDVVVGAWKADVAGPDSGAAYVFSVTPWTQVGDGLAGAAGVPTLTATGSLLPTSRANILVTGGAPFAPATMYIGLSATFAPFKGGVLVPSPDFAVPTPLDASGRALLQTIWPAGVPSDLELLMQAWIVDAAAPVGLSSTNGLSLKTP